MKGLENYATCKIENEITYHTHLFGGGGIEGLGGRGAGIKENEEYKLN